MSTLLVLALVLGLAVWAWWAHTGNMLQLWCDDLLRAALDKHPHDSRLQKARDSILFVSIDSPEDMINYDRMTIRRGRFDRSRGVLYIGMVNHKGKALPTDIVKGILVHEVAHAALNTGKHSSEWQEIFAMLLRVATQELGWNITLECSSCRFYGLCDTMHCPKCAWKECKASRLATS